MGKKGGRYKTQSAQTPKPRSHFTEEDMDDEIDAFHKQRDIIPLDVNDDMDSSDDDDDHPVFNLEGIDEDEEDEDDDDGEEAKEDYRDDKFAAKIVKQQKYMQRKTGGVEDDTHDDAEDEDEDESSKPWTHWHPYGGDNAEFDGQESNESGAEEEEAEIIKLQREKAKLYTEDDFDIEGIDEMESTSDVEKNSEHMPKTRALSKYQQDKGSEDDIDAAFEVKKDLNSLSREEQMAVVESSAPELVGLLSELKDAVGQLDNKVNPLTKVVKNRNDSSKEEIHYLETKQALLLAYCQAITFYLLLKAEGHAVRDHPVIARLVEIRNMLIKMKQLDDELPSEFEDILNQHHGTELGVKPMEEAVILTSEHVRKDSVHSSVSVKTSEAALPHETTEMMKVDIKENGSKKIKRKPQVSSQSMEMLKVREGLEKKLKQKGVFSSVASQLDRRWKSPSQQVNSQLETIHDFGDEVIDKDGISANLSNGHASSMQLTELSKFVLKKLKSSKAVSGDDDLPQRDDFGERRRKHELRVLANAGVEPNDDVKDEHKTLEDTGVKSMNADEEDDDSDESEDETYRQAKRQRYAKLSAKAEQYSRTPMIQTAEPVTVDGKRQINRQIEKNRGLTRTRKKQNPRTKYKKKHDKKVNQWKGAVRGVKKPVGPYGGETSGINSSTSRSRRF